MSRRIVLVDIGSGLTLSGVLPSVALHGAYSAKLIARGGVAPYTFTTSSHLPDGLMLDGATGVLSADDVAEAGTFALVVTVTDLSGASVTRTFALRVITTPLTASGAASAWTMGAPYAYTYAAFGGIAPYTWSIAAGAPPGGLSLDPMTGTLSGTPNSNVSPAWTVRVTDKAGTSVDLHDNAALQLLGQFADGAIGSPYSSDLNINGAKVPYNNPRIMAGDLPAGLDLSVDGNILRLAGTPTGLGGTASFTVSVDSADGQTTASSQDIAIAGIGPPITYVGSLSPVGIAGATTITASTAVANSIAGDQLYIAVMSRFPIQSISDGWAAIGTPASVASDGYTTYISLYSKIKDASDPTTVQVTCNGSDRMNAVVFALRSSGAIAMNEDIHATGANSRDIAMPALSTPHPPGMILWLLATPLANAESTYLVINGDSGLSHITPYGSPFNELRIAASCHQVDADAQPVTTVQSTSNAHYAARSILLRT